MIVSKDNYPLNPKGLNLANYGVVIHPDLKIQWIVLRLEFTHGLSSIFHGKVDAFRRRFAVKTNRMGKNGSQRRGKNQGRFLLFMGYFLLSTNMAYWHHGIYTYTRGIELWTKFAYLYNGVSI